MSANLNCYQEIINNAPGDKWLFIQSGKAPTKAHQGELPEEWLSENGMILVGDQKGNWQSLNKVIGTFHGTRAPIEKIAQEIWDDIIGIRKEISDV